MPAQIQGSLNVCDQCREQVRQALDNCDQSGGETLGLSCNGIVLLQQCTVASPCNLGKDMDGDGKNDSCVAGARCNPASEGSICDPGVVYNCYLRTTVLSIERISSSGYMRL